MVLNLEGVYFCMEKSAPFCLTGLTIMEVVGHPYRMGRYGEGGRIPPFENKKLMDSKVP